MTIFKKLAIAALCLASFSMNAAQINPEAAQRKAQRFLTSSKSLKSVSRASEKLSLAYTSENIYNEDENCFYVFNRSNGGFVVVSADDCAEDILATVDEGTFDYDNMPASMKWWLSQYNTEISEALQSNASTELAAVSRSARHSVEPLVKAKWNQGAPYNAMCPTSNGKPTYTGCVATAIAQIMYVHKWPESGTGEKSYQLQGMDSVASVNFSEAHYDWDNMTDTYNSESTQVQKDAVAQLMYHCGVMMYTWYGSGVSTAEAAKAVQTMWKYMGYAKSVSYRMRSFHNEEDWENILYNELANGRPILYTGGDVFDSHAFVCDGYNAEDNTFHFNWGWSGAGNGYFKVSALKFSIGKSSFNFTPKQTVIIGIQKPSPTVKHDTPIFNNGSYTGRYQAGYLYIDTRNMVEGTGIRAQFSSLGQYDETLKSEEWVDSVAVKFVEQNTGQVILARRTKLFNMTTGSDNTSISLSSREVNLPVGTWAATVLYKDNFDEDWKEVISAPGTSPCVIITKDEDGNYTFETAKKPAKIEVDNMAMKGIAVTGGTITMDATITNTGETDYNGALTVALINDDGTKVASFSKEVNIAAGSTVTVEMTGSLTGVMSGSYSVEVTDQTGMINSDMYNVTISSKVFTGIESVDGDNASIVIASGIITAAGADSIEVYNVAGQKVASAHGETVNAQALASGMYIVKATVDGNTIVKQIVK